MKIYEAAETVLRSSGRAMHVKDIHQEIVRRGLFAFKAKDPIAVLGQTLRKRSDLSANQGRVLFRRVGANMYELAR